MITTSRLPRSGWALCAFVNGMALAIAAPAVMAQGTAQPSSGLMQFPNARIEAATPAQVQRAARSSAVQQGVRAFKDPVSGRLRDQTPEEMAAAAFTQVPDGATSAEIASRRGGVMVELDDSFMSNAVVTKDVSGKAHFQCVEGHDHALGAVLRKPLSTQERRHDR